VVNCFACSIWSAAVAMSHYIGAGFRKSDCHGRSQTGRRSGYEGNLAV
jgi:hypothetical protein